MIFMTKYDSPIGLMTMAGEERGLTGLWFDDQKYYGAGLPETCKCGNLQVFQEAKRWLDIYFAGKDPGFCPTLYIEGTAFRKSVWKHLLEIPYGKTMTYGELAGKLASQYGKSKMSAQAVGGAVGHNPISLLIPCHRIVGSNGKLVGYAGGIERKKVLLDMEKASF